MRLKFLFVLFATLLIIQLVPSGARASTAKYSYIGNNFTTIEFTPGIFTADDRVTASFTVDCTTAHAAGDCRNLPYRNYYSTGAVQPDSVDFSAGPARLPTADGSVDVNRFSFSTDSNGQIIDWDMDLTWLDADGFINVDTDNFLDSAAALGGGAVVRGRPGTWNAAIRTKSPRSIPTTPLAVLVS